MQDTKNSWRQVFRHDALMAVMFTFVSISRCRQPNGGPTQHDPAGRERPEPGGVEVQEGADAGESHRVRQETQGEFSLPSGRGYGGV